MKQTIKIILLGLLITLNSCLTPISRNEIVFSSDTLITQNKYTAKIINNSKEEEMFLQIFCKSSKFPYYSYKIFKFNKNKNGYDTDFVIDDSVYYVQFDISNGKKLIEENNTIQKLVFQRDSNLLTQSFYELLINSKPDNYLNVFKECRKTFPYDLGIFLIKWLYEGKYNLAVKKELISELKYIEDNFPKNGDYFLVLTVGYKLIKFQDEFIRNFIQLSKSTTNLLNNDIISNILNDVLNTKIDKSLENNENKNLILNLMNKNRFSYFTERRLISLISSEIVDINLLNELISKDNYHFYNLLLKKYYYLIINNIEDSIKVLSDIEYKFEYAYKNLFEIYNEGKNCSFGILPNKQIFLEFKFVKFNKLKKYNEVISTLQEQIDYTPKNETYLISSNYERISDVYKNNLYNIDSSLIYLIKAYDLNSKNQNIKNKISKIKNDYFNSQLDLNLWIDSIRLENKRITASRKLNICNLEIIFENERIVKLNNPNKNILLFFYSTTCDPCEIIFDQIGKNQDLLNKTNTEVIYISNEKLNEIKEFLKNKKINIDIVKNSNEINNYFDIVGVPVIIFINHNGMILNRQNGVSEKWRLDENLNLFF